MNPDVTVALANAEVLASDVAAKSDDPDTRQLADAVVELAQATEGLAREMSAPEEAAQRV